MSSVSATVNRVVHWRNQKISMSALMVIRCVIRIHNYSSTAYIGEVESMYKLASREDALISYTYNGISAMLRNLTKRGYFVATRHGRYLSYSPTDKARELFT